MKVLSRTNTDNFEEIIVEYSFLWWKWRSIYRKYGNSIFKYKYGNNFYFLGLREYCDVIELFNIKL